MTAIPLPPLDRDRLARVLGMLGSAHDGEIAAAGRRANALVIAAGLTWPQVVAPPPRITATAAPTNVWAQKTIEGALANPEQLNEWERRFVTSLFWQQRPLTPRQFSKLAEIADKLGLHQGHQS